MKTLRIWMCVFILSLGVQSQRVFGQSEFGVASVQQDMNGIAVIAKPSSLLDKAMRRVFPQSRGESPAFRVCSIFDGKEFIYLSNADNPSRTFLSVLQTIPPTGELRFRIAGGTIVSINRKDEELVAVRTTPPFGIGTQSMDSRTDDHGYIYGLALTAETGSPLALAAKKAGYAIEGEKALTPSPESRPFIVVAVKVGNVRKRIWDFKHPQAEFTQTIWEAPRNEKLTLILSDDKEIEVERRSFFADWTTHPAVVRAVLDQIKSGR